uniref:Uncharacterized protein n=1 Tax=Accipiter nisus TaxID=211598 RepID=A0A8B9N6Q3_9AVES
GQNPCLIKCDGFLALSSLVFVEGVVLFPRLTLDLNQKSNTVLGARSKKLYGSSLCFGALLFCFTGTAEAADHSSLSPLLRASSGTLPPSGAMRRDSPEGTRGKHCLLQISQ